MNLQLSWDLFIIVFFGIIVAYSFIIGRNGNLKVILATYVAALCADAIGNLFASTLALSGNFMKLLHLFYINTTVEAIVVSKILSFLLILVLLSVRGSYSVEVSNSRSASLRISINMLFGFLNACLIVSIALIFVSGDSFIIGNTGGTSVAFQQIYDQSNLAKILIDHYSIWFLFPALSFLGISLFSEKTE
jgi:hypothetical protein